MKASSTQQAYSGAVVTGAPRASSPSSAAGGGGVTSLLPKVPLTKKNVWKDPTHFTNACAALNIKPNSKVVEMEAEILSSATVNLNGNYLGGKCFNALTQLLVLNTSLRTLNVSNNGLSNESVVFFARSVKDHPTLECIDLSMNPISLPAATALSTLLQTNRVITQINITGTQIEDGLARKIARTLNLRLTAKNRAITSASNSGFGSSSIGQQQTPYQRVLEAQTLRACDKRSTIRAEKLSQELDRQQMSSTHVRDALRHYFGNVPDDSAINANAYPRASSGWAIVNVSISCAPNAFHSELVTIYHDVFPRINKQLESVKIHLNPVAMFNEIDPHRFDPKGDKNANQKAIQSLYGSNGGTNSNKAAKNGVDRKSIKQLVSNFGVTVDFNDHIRRTAPFHIHLLGEKIGLAEQPAMFPRDGGSSLEPPASGGFTYKAIQYREYQQAKDMPVSILMSRTSTQAMHVPSAFVPILSDDPALVHPDEHSRLILEKVAAARGDVPSTLDGYFDINVEKAKWVEFCQFKKSAIIEHPATCLVCEDYHAEFDKVDQHGNVILKGLTTADDEGDNGSSESKHKINFSSGLEARLRAGIGALFPEAAYVWKMKAAEAATNTTTETGVGAKPAVDMQMEAYIDSISGRRSGSSFEDGLAQRRIRSYINSAVITVQRKRRLGSPAAGEEKKDGGGGVADEDDLPSTIPATITVGRRGVMGKLDLYAVTPPSRNMTLLHVTPSSGTTSTLRSFLSRSYKKGSFIVAHHFAREVSLYGEPTDPRNMFLNLIKQIDIAPPTSSSSPSTTSPGSAGNSNATNATRLPTYILNEVHVNKVQDTFTAALARISSSAPDNSIILIVIDGLDDIEPAVVPCDALRMSDTGLDVWDPSANVNGSRPTSNTGSGGPLRDVFTYLPICLPKNVRIVASCQTSSDTHKILERRGHDSCDPVAVGDMTEHEAEQLLVGSLREIPGIFIGAEADKPNPTDIAITESILADIMGIEACRDGGYLQFVIESIRGLKECPFGSGYDTTLSTTGVMPIQTLISGLPKTFSGACDRILDQLERLCGLTFARKAVSLLLTSRWGLLDVELSGLLARNDKATQSRQMQRKELVSGDQLQRLLRLLRPVLKKDPSSSIQRAAAITYSVEQGKVPLCVNGLEYVRYIENRTFRTVATNRYLNTPALEITTHQLLAHYYHAQYLEPCGVFSGSSVHSQHHPLLPKAIKECVYHVVKGGMWKVLQEWAVNLSFICCTYELGLGYQVLRELVRGFNLLHAASPESCGISSADKTVMLERLREYVYFIKNHNINLVQFPHMAQQIAITNPPGTFLHRDAEAFFKATDTYQPHFRAAPKSLNKTHQDSITGCCFAPSGMRFATCSDDRVIKIFSVSGDLVHSINLSASRLKRVVYSRTSRYIMTMAEDRTVFVYDASSSNLVCKFHGHNSPVHGLAFSCRGRFVFTGSEDRTMKIWDAETGRLAVSVPHSTYTHASSASGGVNHIVPHSSDEYQLYVGCDKKIIGWKLNMARDACEQTLCINTHNTLPLGSIHMARCDTVVIGISGGTLASSEPTAHAEVAIKAWSIATGRCLMHFAMPGSMAHTYTPVSGVLSTDERYLAVSFSDGSVVVYKPPYNSATDESNNASSEPCMVPIHAHLSAFINHPVSRVADMCFSNDSSMVALTGNQRQLKVYGIPDAPNAYPALHQPTVSEYLLEHQMTCVAWNENPQEDTPEIIAGDATGRLHSLYLIR